MHPGASQISTEQTRPRSEGDRDLVRVLALLEGDRTGVVTVFTLREHGVRSPDQAVYDLQLAGYPIDRVSHTNAGGDRTLGYRLGASAMTASDSLAGGSEVDRDDE
jgi:hypothetical protein